MGATVGLFGNVLMEIGAQMALRGEKAMVDANAMNDLSDALGVIEEKGTVMSEEERRSTLLAMRERLRDKLEELDATLEEMDEPGQGMGRTR